MLNFPYQIFHSYKSKLNLLPSPYSSSILPHSLVTPDTILSLTNKIISKTEETLSKRLKKFSKQINVLSDKIDCKDKQNTERFAEIERKKEERDGKLWQEVLKKVEKMGSKLKDVRKNQDAKNVEIEEILETVKCSFLYSLLPPK